MLRWELGTTSLGVVLVMSEVQSLLPVALALMALPWPLRLWRRRRLSVGTPLDWPLGLFLVTAGVAVWAAYDRSLAGPKFWLIVGGVALYYALVNAPAAQRVPNTGNASSRSSVVHGLSSAVLHRWLLALCLAWAMLGIYFVTQRDWAAEPTKFAAITELGSWIAAHTPDLPGPDINGNVMAGALAVVLPLNIGLVLDIGWEPRARNRRKTVSHDKELPAATPAQPTNLPISQSTGSPVYLSTRLLLALLTLLLITFALEMTGSRGAWLAVGAGVGLWLVDGLRPFDGAQGRLQTRRVADVLVVAIILVAAALLLWPGMAARMAQGQLLGGLGAIPVGATALNRVDLFGEAGTLLRDYAFTGSGLGCFMMVYSSYVMLLHVGFITHAHNLFLQIGIEQGLPALVGFVWLLAAFFWSQRSRRHGPAGAGIPQSAMRSAAVCSVLVIIVHGMVDASLYASRTLPFMFVPLGLGVGTGYWILGTGDWRRGTGGSGVESGDGRRETGGSGLDTGYWRLGTGDQLRRKSPTALRRALAAWRGAVIGDQVGSAISDRGSGLGVRGWAVLRRAWPLAALAIVALAVVALPPLRAGFYANLGAVGQTRAELSVYEWPAYPIQDAVRRVADLSGPVAAFERALASDPGNATANRRLGMIELSLGEYAPALQHLARAHAAEAGSQTTRQLLGEALIVNGRVDEGAALWSTVDNATGQLAARQWWYEHIGEAQRVEWIRQARGA